MEFKIWELGLNTMGYLRNKETEKHLEIIKKTGYKYILIDSDPNWIENFPTKYEINLIESNRIELIPYSLHIPTIFKKWTFNSKYILGCLKKMVEIGEIFKVSYLTIHPFPEIPYFPKNINRNKFLNDYIKKLSEVLFYSCEFAEKIGLSFTLETTGFLHLCHISLLKKIIKTVNLPNLGICLDTGHTNIAGLDISKTIKKCGNLLFETHFNDNFGIWDKKIKKKEEQISLLLKENYDIHRPVGIGTINWLKIIKSLKEIRYNRPIIFELSLRKEDNFKKMAEFNYYSWREVEKIWERNENKN